jgi:hypothetical protein
LGARHGPVEDAKKQIDKLMAISPGEYVVLNLRTRKKIIIKPRAKQGRQPRQPKDKKGNPPENDVN